MSNRTLMITRGAVIAAAYVTLTLSFHTFSFGPLQFRIAEALTLLPLLFVEAIPGLFLGCLIANIFGGLGPFDIYLGSAATLCAAVLTYRAPNRFLAVLSPIAVNGLVVGGYLAFLTPMPLVATVLYVAAGQAGVCILLGIPMIELLDKSHAIKKAKKII